jgi:hypothetical protein
MHCCVSFFLSDILAKVFDVFVDCLGYPFAPLRSGRKDSEQRQGLLMLTFDIQMN